MARFWIKPPLDKQEAEAYQARYGRLHPDLAAQVATGDQAKAIDVIIWLKEPVYTGPARPEPVTNPLVISEKGATMDARASDQQEAMPEKEAMLESVGQAVDTAAQDAFLAQVDAQRAEAVAPVVAPVVTRLTDLGFQGDERPVRADRLRFPQPSADP